MSWHYALRKKTAGGETWCDVVEVYGKGQYTEHGIRPGGETLEAVAKELTRMAADIVKHPVIDETEG